MKKQFAIPGFTDKSVMSLSASADKAVMLRVIQSGKRAVYLKWLLGIAALGLIIGGGGYYYSQHQQPASTPLSVAQKPVNYISNDQLEAEHGIRITLIAVTGAGGIVEFRYKVSDPQKAAALLHDTNSTPILTAIESGLSLAPTQMGRHHSQTAMKRGAVPFTFYPNVRGAIKPGKLVSVSFGDVKVEPIAAK